MMVIEAENIHKSYDGIPALRGLTLNVRAGESYALLGPNGAGKSTLLHLLLGFLRPDRGKLRVLGSASPQHVVGRVGYLPERLRYHLRYTAREYLRYLGRFSDLPRRALDARIDRELQAVGLSDTANHMLSSFSRGMLQRLGIVQALIHEPELLLIDEPTSGLDPSGQRELVDLLMTLRRRGHTTLMATHILDEAEQLCDRLGILFEGALAVETDIARLRGPGRDTLIVLADLPPALATQLEQLDPAVGCVGATVTIRPNAPALQARVLRTILDADVPIVAIEPRVRPIEELYLRVVRGEPAELPVAPAQLPGRDTVQRPPSDQPPPVRPGPAGQGDTLLRELLRRDDRSDQS
jgi:ABC-2 type transport system ATP-binding protein